MDALNISESIIHLNCLKKESQKKQKKGLPFMVASVVLWSLILAIQFIDKPINVINMCTFVVSVLLMPLAYLFSIPLKARIFGKTNNPIDRLGIMCTMNQMLYILIVMWAASRKPEAVMMIYAMVFGAHLLPFGWIYDNKIYIVASIAETVGVLLLNIFFGNAVSAGFVVIMQIVVSIILYADVRKENNC